MDFEERISEKEIRIIFFTPYCGMTDGSTKKNSDKSRTKINYELNKRNESSHLECI